ncbi:hypothetical protein BX616_007815 [Lobosporangium transversale]|nr:hypothetical protein BX616_007815 [Lobosporangium transversale]
MELEYSRSYEELLLLLLQQQESESVAKIAIDYPKDFRKREKALLASNMYQKKLMTLLLPQTHTDFNHTVSFLGKEGVYTLGHGGVPYHDQNGKFVTKGCLYEVLAYCRRKSPKEDVMKHLQRLGINGKFLRRPIARLPCSVTGQIALYSPNSNNDRSYNRRMIFAHILTTK